MDKSEVVDPTMASLTTSLKPKLRWEINYLAETRIQIESEPLVNLALPISITYRKLLNQSLKTTLNPS